MSVHSLAMGCYSQVRTSSVLSISILFDIHRNCRENEVKLREWLEMVGMSDARRSLESMAYDKEKFPLLLIIAKDRGSYNIVDICTGTLYVYFAFL